MCVFDFSYIPKNIPNDCEAYMCLSERGSIVGNAQRNFALDRVEKGHIYFNDDDTVLHNRLWRKIEMLENHDFIHFSQIEKNGGLRLKGDKISVGTIDSHNFIVSKECVGDTRWVLDRYDADGIFAETCYKKSKSPIFIPKVLSIYNYLR